MSVKAMSLVGLDVHARQTHAAVLDLGTGELAVQQAADGTGGGGGVPGGAGAGGARGV